jgi:hypothetical protein
MTHEKDRFREHASPPGRASPCVHTSSTSLGVNVLFVDGCMGFRLHGVLATTSTTSIGKSVQIRVAGQNKFRNTSPPRIFDWASLIFESGRERDEILT